MKFIASRELGRLARWLRILGYDTLYRHDNNKSALIIAALRDDRVVLTRSKLLVKDKALNSVFINADGIKQQLAQVIDECRLSVTGEALFQRCILCNEVLEAARKEDVAARVPAYVLKTQEAFFQCRQCRRIYWQGTHWGNVNEIMATITRTREQ